MNTITLIGRLGSDIDIRSTGSGMSVTNFSVALPSKRNGEEQTTWVRAVAFGEVADNLSASASKGDRLISQGRLQESSWTDKEGNERKSMELILDDAGVALRWSRKQQPDTYGGGEEQPF